ncbi:MAG TPA: hypothetical protein VEU08_01335 [Vicinamibacterales bacterium]|nr:hypothetical protein [Vicinamibacterales bacterium]
MNAGWTTVYDVSRDGIGIIPWIIALVWLAGLGFGLVLALGTLVLRFGRALAILWLTGWTVMGGVGVGNMFYQYAANVRALHGGTCELAEGHISRFHRQNIGEKSSEHFVVGGREFRYSRDNLANSALRDSDGREAARLRPCRRPGQVRCQARGSAMRGSGAGLRGPRERPSRGLGRSPM